MPNRFCKDCIYYSEGIGHCSFGFTEFKFEGPVDCYAHEVKMSKKDYLCHNCMHMQTYGQTNRDFCDKNQVFFLTKKAEGCQKFEGIKKGTVVIPLPPPKDHHDNQHRGYTPPIYNKPRFKTFADEELFYKMVI